MRNAKVLLRIAAGLMFIHLLGHAVGHATWDKPEDPKMLDVVTAMKSYEAEFMGSVKSMADYYNGYSLLIFGVYAMSLVLLWITSGFVQEQTVIAKKILYPVGITLLFFGIVEFLFFFPFAASMSFLAGILAISSVTVLKK
jgi:hypothetical protein